MMWLNAPAPVPFPPVEIRWGILLMLILGGLLIWHILKQ